MRLRKYKVPFNRINQIFISHMHGDHYLGLMGLLLTFNLHHRTNDLSIFSPPGLAEILTLQLKYSQTSLNFKVHMKELDPESPQCILEDDTLTIDTIPMDHRIPCCGFLFREKPKKWRLVKEKLTDDISIQDRKALKDGENVLDQDGNLKYKLEDYTYPPPKSRSFAYCSDTKVNEKIIPLIEGVDLLYHEATFLDELSDRADLTYHSTALQAATLAKKANIRELLIGHFSIRYKDLEGLLKEAQSVFSNCSLAIEGKSFSIQD